MPRSSVGSAPGDTLLDTYPVDDIIENTNCELHSKMKNISMKVADGVAFPVTPEATYHCIPIPEGYARVMVDEVVEPYSMLALDIAGGDGERTLGEAVHRHPMKKGLHYLSKSTDTASSADSSKSATESADSRSSKSTNA